LPCNREWGYRIYWNTLWSPAILETR
jgi:hypothetical protein